MPPTFESQILTRQNDWVVHEGCKELLVSEGGSRPNQQNYPAWSSTWHYKHSIVLRKPRVEVKREDDVILQICSYFTNVMIINANMRIIIANMMIIILSTKLLRPF